MEIKIFLLVLIAILNLGDSQEHNRENRVVGGFESRPHQFPYLVALILTVNEGPQSFCGGSIIGPSYILTAAHCVENVNKIDVMAGIHNVFTDTPIYHAEVFERDYLMHFAYNPRTLEHDIALIFLRKSIPDTHIFVGLM